MKRHKPNNRKKPSDPAAKASSTFIESDRVRLAGLLRALPALLSEDAGGVPKTDTVASMVGLGRRTFTELLGARYKSATILNQIHAHLSREGSEQERELNRKIRKAIHLDEFLHKYLPAMPRAAAKAGQPPAPDVYFDTETLRLYAFAQNLDAEEIARLERVFACTKGPYIRDTKHGLNEGIIMLSEILESFCRGMMLSPKLSRSIDRIRAHIHVVGMAHNRATGKQAPALLPVAHFSLLHSIDSEEPVFLDLDWYTIVKAYAAERALVQVIKLEERPNTFEANEVPPLACVMAHPLRNRETGKVFGMLSFDCLVDEGRKANSHKTLNALGWNQPNSDHPTAYAKTMMQLLSSITTRMLHLHNLRIWLEAFPE